MVLTIQTETTFQTLHAEYVEATKQNYPNAYIFSLDEIKHNITENSKPTDDIDALMQSVLEAMIYTSSNTVKEMVERAEADFSRRFQDMTTQQQQVCLQYRLKMG